ncbi:GTPase family protein [Fimbriiglobus ruber]|nr:GTPase [Fimbriiglobus ruber]
MISLIPTRIKLRVSLVTVLAVAPVLFLTAAGAYHLWDRGWSFVAYWPMFACWFASYLLMWYWTRRSKVVVRGAAADPLPGYWTDRDKRAWELVEAQVDAVKTVTADQLSDLKRYAAEAQDLALQIARVYNPTATDPFGHLTLPEILACGELIAHDMNKLVDKYVPGSHLLTVNDIQRLRDAVDTATDWYPRLRNIYWAVSAVFDPIKVGLQVAATKAGLAPASKGFQQNVMMWFQTTYTRELGRYLIELNSGRLKVGAKRYQELMALHQVPPLGEPGTAPHQEHAGSGPDTGSPAPSAPPEPSGSSSGSPSESPNGETVPPVTVAVVGPVKAGKSSLVNTLLGDRRAGTDVLPLTAGVTKYQLRQPGLPELCLLDSAGFGQAGPTDADVAAAVEAARHADVMLLVVPARSAARKPEVDFLDRIRAGVAATPNLKLPPVLLVLSHVDLLSPAMEWAPPYDWEAGSRPKEVQIREACAAAREQFGANVLSVIPVCTAAGKELGVRDELLTTIAGLLGEARGVGLLRALHLEALAGRTKKVVRQLVNAGGQLLKAYLESSRKS